VTEGLKVAEVFRVLGSLRSGEGGSWCGTESRRSVWLNDGNIGEHGGEVSDGKVWFCSVVVEEGTRFDGGGSASKTREAVENVNDPVVTSGGAFSAEQHSTWDEQCSDQG
jgi:hypothetical protein